jgi:type III restriction enzyme
VELDRLPEVKHWVRNLAGQGREHSSLWLQTRTDRFYPDFVAALDDGRMFAVEYKGDAYRSNDDSKEKDTLGHLWADRSGGRTVFLMAEKQNRGRGLPEQLRAAIAVQARGLH